MDRPLPALDRADLGPTANGRDELGQDGQRILRRVAAPMTRPAGPWMRRAGRGRRRTR